MKIFLRALILSILLSLLTFAQTAPTAMLHRPTVSSTQIVFSYGDDLWAGPRDGGPAHPLTTGSGIKTDPFISPDGKWIAYSGTYDGNTDVYIMPAGGGIPQRLTYHPGADNVLGWTPDSSAVLFRSTRNSYSRFARLFTVALTGGLPHEMTCDRPRVRAGEALTRWLLRTPRCRHDLSSTGCEHAAVERDAGVRRCAAETRARDHVGKLASELAAL